MQTAAASKPQEPSVPPTPLKLYWNERGAVCCGIHAPYPGTDTWEWEHWKLLSPGERRAFVAAEGRFPECELKYGCGDLS